MKNIGKQYKPIIIAILINIFSSVIYSIITTIFPKFNYTIISPLWILLLINIIVSLVSIYLFHIFTKEVKPSDKIKLIEIVNKKYTYETVILDGMNFVQCEFDNVKFIYEGRSAFSMSHCNLNNPRIQFNEFSAQTIKVLHGFYQDPCFRPIIEQTFDNIKNNKY